MTDYIAIGLMTQPTVSKYWRRW